jgi:hypothetical protein
VASKRPAKPAPPTEPNTDKDSSGESELDEFTPREREDLLRDARTLEPYVKSYFLPQLQEELRRRKKPT